ncbi:epithelial membrane protein 3-like isoform X2 [Strigops habroptila]|nr:epithelial membrane protein 3-like isoform X2 [Strigops habroptila]
MSFLLFALTGLHGLGLLLLFIATLGKAWWVLPDGGTLNLWYDCEYLNSTHGWACTSTGDSPCLRAARGLLPAALLLSAASFMLFLWQLRGGPRGSVFIPAGGTQLLAALAALLGAGLYAARGGRPLAGGFGPCFGLVWAAAALALGSGCAYLRLRKGA